MKAKKEIGTLERLRCLAFAGMPLEGDICDAAADCLFKGDWKGFGLCVSALTLRVLAKAHGKGKGNA